MVIDWDWGVGEIDAASLSCFDGERGFERRGRNLEPLATAGALLSGCGGVNISEGFGWLGGGFGGVLVEWEDDSDVSSVTAISGDNARALSGLE
mmetsp:Transcript_36777/g.74683  ORF Transcript_36777/g.74683 Transcript_36777/m.74683 type:complete len:94 (-) Transcript_36777:942-1223(-)